MKVLFVTGFCAHYRVKTFEYLASRLNTTFLFFSDSGERYWDKRHGKWSGRFSGKYLAGFRVFGTRIAPSLIFHLLWKDYDVVVKCIIGRFALPVTYAISRIRGKPFVLWTNLWYHPETRFHRFSRIPTEWIYRHSDAIVACGAHVARYLRDRGVDPSKVFISDQAVDNDLFGQPQWESVRNQLRQELQSDGKKVILFVGRLDAIKGIEFLLEAFALLNNANSRLVLVGDGREKEMLERNVRERGLADSVIFRHYVENTKLAAYYAIANVLVLPSVTVDGTKEVWGLVVNEAMNQGCPVVVTESVGAAAGGLVRDGITGFVIPERDAGALKIALEKILDEEPLESRMRVAARESILAWTYERQVNGFVEAISFVISRKYSIENGYTALDASQKGHFPQ